MTGASRRWIGIDGEGIGRAPHRYTLLAWSDATGQHGAVRRPDGLSTVECLETLLATPQGARLAGFFLGYDWTMILRDLPDWDIYKLFRPELRQLPAEEGSGFSRVDYRGYSLHYLAGAMRIRSHGRSVVVWDLGKFYQCSFVKALRDWKIGDAATVDAIEAMKARRSGFTDNDSAEVDNYCLTECRLLAELAGALESAHAGLGVNLGSYHGPGSTAKAFLKRWRIDERRGTQPEAVQEAADRAFFGGRFEQARQGTIDDVSGYDIRSAYPFQTYNLPCLEHAHWERVTRVCDLPSLPSRAAHALVHYRLSDIGAKATWGPLPVRTAKGTILFPRGGSSGWIWLDEFRAAQKGWKGVHFAGEAWILRTDCDCHVFESVLDLYRMRVALGASERGIVVKLGVNSLYGSIAQKVGHPRYANRCWAGMITSGTRAQILRLLSQDPDAVLAIATDGIYSTHSLDLPPAPLAPDTLGDWETKQHGRMTFVRPGIYWAHGENTKTIRARGLGRKQLEKHREGMLAALRDGGSFAPDGTWAEGIAYLGSSEVFGGARSTIYRRQDGSVKRSALYGEWHSIPARVRMDPAPKRAEGYKLHKLPGIESAPYTKAPDTESRAHALIKSVFWASM